MIWKPHATVAAVIERQQRFLLVEEIGSRGIGFNQPAGHLENDEDLITAVKREVFEETAWQFEPKHLLSVQLWRKNKHDSFLRVCFSGDVHSHDPDQPLDDGIIQTHWLTREEIAEKKSQLRSPLVLTSVDDYLKGEFHPLSLLQSCLNNNG
ncbi:MAG: NUDIX hydrolase [Methylococcales bacterium]|nr:NUDIX hydrolase [Methylococcales bacterium]